jgi:hypothetical protein
VVIDFVLGAGTTLVAVIIVLGVVDGIVFTRLNRDLAAAEAREAEEDRLQRPKHILALLAGDPVVTIAAS